MVPPLSFFLSQRHPCFFCLRRFALYSFVFARPPNLPLRSPITGIRAPREKLAVMLFCFAYVSRLRVLALFSSLFWFRFCFIVIANWPAPPPLVVARLFPSAPLGVMWKGEEYSHRPIRKPLVENRY
jgi:hypothetical protein